MKLLDYILITIIFSCAGVITYFFTIDIVHTCTSDPLTYTSNQFLKDYGHELAGELYFMDANNYTFRLIFNASGYVIKDPAHSGVVQRPIPIDINFSAWDDVIIK